MSIFSKIKEALFTSYYDRNFRKKNGPRYSRTDSLEDKNNIYIEAEKEDNTPEFNNEEHLKLMGMANDILEIKKSAEFKNKERIKVIIRAGSVEKAKDLADEVKEFDTFKNKNIDFEFDINDKYSDGMDLIHTNTSARFTGTKSAYELVKERHPDITPEEFLNSLRSDIPVGCEVKRVIYRDDSLGKDGIPTYVVEKPSKIFTDHIDNFRKNKLEPGEICIYRY